MNIRGIIRAAIEMNSAEIKEELESQISESLNIEDLVSSILLRMDLEEMFLEEAAEYLDF